MAHSIPDRQPGAAAITLARYTHLMPDALELARKQNGHVDRGRDRQDVRGCAGQLSAQLPGRVRRGDRTTLMLADGTPATQEMELDPFWRVRFNVQRDRLEGWLLYGK
jgi:hypothetical protein